MRPPHARRAVWLARAFYCAEAVWIGAAYALQDPWLVLGPLVALGGLTLVVATVSALVASSWPDDKENAP